MQNSYRGTLLEQLRKYTSALPPKVGDSLWTMVAVGELTLAAVDLVSALVEGAVSVDPADVPTLRWLLGRGTLPPDTPADLLDRLRSAGDAARVSGRR